MSEDRTADMDGRSFEERVFARFDAIDARLESVEMRLEKLEAKSYDTKPIWERALAELLELREKVDNVDRKIDVLGRDMVQMRADQVRTERRIDNLEAR
jgi:archaellum component FlaC